MSDEYSNLSGEEIIIKALGTMIMAYDKKIHPETFEAYYINPRQVSILSDESRKILEDKLIQIIQQYE